MTLRPTRPIGAVHPAAAPFALPIPQVLIDACAAHPDRLLVVDGEVRLTYRELVGRAGAVQQQLRENGVGVGDVVTVQLPNWWETVAAMWAVWGLGAVVNPVTPIYRGSELRGILGSARPAAVVVPGRWGEVDYPGMVAGALREVGHRAVVLTVDRDAAVRTGAFTAAAAGPDDVAMLMYTSGTTGRAKGVLHTHRSLLYEAASIAGVCGLADDTVFMPSPLTHITGLLYGVLMPVQTGGAVALLARWDADRAVEVIETQGCTMTVSATPFLRGLTEAYRARGSRSSLRTFVCGGADIPAALVVEAEAVLGTTVARTYGSTEMPTLCIVRPDDDPARRTGTEGRPIGGAAGRIAGSGTYGTAGISEASGTGELEVRGPELFVGYLDPADNTGAFTDDGWFATGDLARIDDDGTICIVGRLKDVIIRGGENISAKEVEDLLLTHPAVRDVAVVAMPDNRLGERACAVVVAESSLALTDLAMHLDAHGLARQKFPEALLVVAELPRTVSGKVQKFQLRAAVTQALRAGGLELR